MTPQYNTAAHRGLLTLDDWPDWTRVVDKRSTREGIMFDDARQLRVRHPELVEEKIEGRTRYMRLTDTGLTAQLKLKEENDNGR